MVCHWGASLKICGNLWNDKYIFVMLTKCKSNSLVLSTFREWDQTLNILGDKIIVKCFPVLLFFTLKIFLKTAVWRKSSKLQYTHNPELTNI